MRRALAALIALGLLALGARPVVAVEQVTCGRVMGYTAATAATTGSLVIARPGDVAPNGFYVVVPAGVQVATTSGWVCLRTTDIGPTPVAGGFTATQALVSVIPPGASDYLAEPSPEIACGRLISFVPATATERGQLTLDQLRPPPAPLPAPSGGTVVPPGISFSVTPGTQLGYADLQGYFCVRFTAAISPRTFLGLVAPSSSGYLAEPAGAAPAPTAGPAKGATGIGGTATLPNTSTDPSGRELAATICVAALLMVAAAVGRRGVL